MLLRLQGRGPRFDEVAAELEATPPGNAVASAAADPAAVDAELHVNAQLPVRDFRPQVFSAKGRFNYERDCFYRADPVPHRVDSWLDTTRACRAAFAVQPAKPRQRVLALQHACPIMTYTGFWGWLHFVLGRRAAGFVHAGIASVDGAATCFVGTGGSGKTSALFSLLEEPEQRYLSEDFGIVDRSGRTYYCPKHVSIYASDTRSAVLQQAVRTQLTLRQQGLWQYKSLSGNPRVKLSPRAIVGPRVNTSAEIARTFYLVRSASSTFEARSLSADELAQRAASVARRELAAWAESLLLIAANDVLGASFPTLDQVEEDLRALYRAAFAHAERSLLIVPHGFSGADLLRALRQAKKLPA